MLKRVVSAVFCLLALLSACEPNGTESMEPVLTEGTDISLGNGQTNPGNPAVMDASAVAALAEVNALRQKGCKCGDEPMPPTSRVAWNAKLYDAALAHAKDMHIHNYFSHTSPSGENVYHRLVASGYISDAIGVLTYGENIAFGNFDLAAAVQKWLASPSHCANMMRGSYREMAIAHDGNYWVQVFGATRE